MSEQMEIQDDSTTPVPVVIEPQPIAEAPEDSPALIDGDVDVNGHLAIGLFFGVISVLLVLIYALAMAAR